jgi:hypothetical protein
MLLVRCPVVVKGPDGLPGTRQSGPLYYASRQPFQDLLTRRTVGLLKLYSLLPDADHFIHREQTHHLEVMNSVANAPGPSVMVAYMATNLPPAAFTSFSNASLRLVFGFLAIACMAFGV